MMRLECLAYPFHYKISKERLKLLLLFPEKVEVKDEDSNACWDWSLKLFAYFSIKAIIKMLK